MGAGTLRLIIDRFEAGFAVCEYGDRKMVNLPHDLLPDGAAEGDVLTLSITPDKDSTAARKEYIKKLTKDFWK